MTKLTGIYDNVQNAQSAGLCGGAEVPVPFTLNQLNLAANQTAMEYITVLVDDNGVPNGSDGLCVSASGFSDEHDHIQ